MSPEAVPEERIFPEAMTCIRLTAVVYTEVREIRGNAGPEIECVK